MLLVPCTKFGIIVNIRVLCSVLGLLILNRFNILDIYHNTADLKAAGLRSMKICNKLHLFELNVRNVYQPDYYNKIYHNCKGFGAI